MNSYYAYTRVSTVKQGEGASLEAQKQSINAYAARNNLKISKWFEEKETAAKIGRPVFSKLIADLRRRKAGGLIVHKIDRSARNFKDWAQIGDLAEIGCDIHFAFESLDFNSRGGRLAADIQAVVAADYIRNLRDESIKGQKMRLQQGVYPYKSPLGYLDKGKGQLKTICKHRGPLVRRMFELYASGGHSIRSLAIEMERLGLTSQKGGVVAKSNIEHMLKNPFYMGVIKIRRSGQIYAGKHEPLITAELFETVTRQRQGGRTVQKQTRHNHRYRGLWRCGLCNGAMIAEKQKGNIYYRCHVSNCDTKCVGETDLEAQVSTMLQMHGLTEKQCKHIKKAVLEFVAKDENVEKEHHAKAELKKLDTRENNLNEKYLDTLIDDETYKTMKEKLILTRIKWEGIWENSKQKRIDPEKLTAFLERAKNLYLSYISGTPSEKREIVKYTTSNRRVIQRHVELEPQNWLETLQKGEVSKIVYIIRSQIERQNLI